MKILWYTDTHFGKSGAFSYPSPSGYSTRLDETLELHRWINGLVQEHNPDMTINGGDVFKPQVTLHAAEVSAAISGTSKIIQSSNLHLLLLGNHDYLSRDTKVTSVDWVETYPNSRLIRQVDTHEVDDDTLLVFIPYVWDYSYVEKKVTELTQGYSKVYVFGHAEILGAVDSVVMDLGSGEAKEHRSSSKSSLSPKFLSQFTLAFNGHHHIPQKIHGNVMLTGSTQQFTVTEVAQDIPRGVYLIDTETSEVEFFENNITPKIYRVENNIEALKKLPRQDYVVYYAKTDETDFEELVPILREFKAHQLKKITPEKFKPLSKVDFKSKDEDYTGIYEEYLDTLSFEDQKKLSKIESRGKKIIQSIQKAQ